MKANFDIIILGAGLVGLTTALACAHKGASVCLLDAASPDKAYDGRASAIAASSFTMLEHLGVAAAMEGQVQPITDMLIADGAVGDVSPLTLHFDSHDAGGPTGYMIENAVLRGVLLVQVKASDKVDLRAPVEIKNTARTAKNVTVTLDDSTILTASLLVAADGRNSALRRAANIDVQRFAYDQKAIVTTFAHELQTDAFTTELARRIGGFLGEIKLSAPRQAYPLSLQMAERYTDTRLVLVGDAAHAIHPIAGQGLNMGLRDAAALADSLLR